MYLATSRKLNFYEYDSGKELRETIEKSNMMVMPKKSSVMASSSVNPIQDRVGEGGWRQKAAPTIFPL